ETLEHGMKLLDPALADEAASSSRVVPGKIAFTLYDTYGFPVDLTADIARERGWTVDMAGFEAAMEQQRERARSASHFDSKATLPAEVASTLAPTRFLGYETLSADGAKVLAIVRDGRAVDVLEDDEDAFLIL